MPKKSFAQVEMQYSFSIMTSLYNQATQVIVQIVSRAIAGGLVDCGLNTADSEAGGGQFSAGPATSATLVPSATDNIHVI